MEKVLVIRFSSLGDIVLTTGPIAHFKQQHPDIELHLLTSDVGAEIYQSSIDIEKIIIVPKGSSKKDLLKSLSDLEEYDAIIDLQGTFKSWLTRFFVKAPYFRLKKQSRERRAFVKKRKYASALTKHVVEKYYHTFQEAYDLNDAMLEDLRPQLFPNNLSFSKEKFDFSKAVVIHPFASQSNKEWPYFADLIERLIDRGYSVVLVGADDTISNLPTHEKLLDLRKRTNIIELCSIIKASQGLISTDSGPMHLGLSVNKPTLGIFGPTTKEFGFYPVFHNSQAIEIEDLSCRPCHVHGGNHCPLGHHKCMKDISAEQVIEKFESMLN